MITELARRDFPQELNRQELNHLLAWRELWQDHTHWTRIAIIDIVGDLPELAASQNRLLRNVDDMMGLLEPYYGSRNLAPLRDLMRDHLLIAAQLVLDAKNEVYTVGETEAKWYSNADTICRFLSSVNTRLDYSELKDMFDKHLSMTKDEAVYELQQNWPESVNIYDEIQSETLKMADMLAEAILLEYPEKFGWEKKEGLLERAREMVHA